MRSQEARDLAFTGIDFPDQLAAAMLSAVTSMEDLLLHVLLRLLELGFNPRHCLLKLLDGLASFAG